MPWKLVTEFTFDSAHKIDDYKGACGRLHGHTYKVKIELIAEKLRKSEFLSRENMVVDFKSLKWAKKDWEEGGLDHALLNDVPELDGNTTAEQIAKYIHQKTMEKIKMNLENGDNGLDLKLKVILWETPDSYCEYWE